MPYTGNKIIQIKKRDGKIVDFESDKISLAIFKAMRAVGEPDKEKADELADQVVEILNKKFQERSIPGVEEIQDIVEFVLLDNKLLKVAKAFIIYRDQRNKMRELRTMVNSDELMEGYLKQMDWRVKENSNMDYSLQGLNNYVASTVSANYWLNKIYPPNIRDAHVNGDFHIHDLQILGPYCCGWDLKDLLLRGFSGVRGKVESKAPKHMVTAMSQLFNFFYTLQGEAAGAQAISSFDTLIAPFIRYDNLNYDQVKQNVQMFLFNMNVPTRVGFQCLSADTEILTPGGWRGCDDLKKGDLIKTYNIKNGNIEDKTVKKIFSRQYKGIMYNLKNRIQDQLISPNHKVVRKKFQSEEFILEPIEDIVKMKSPFIIPIAGKNARPDVKLTDAEIKLACWIIAEGTIEHYASYRHSRRVTIYQSAIKNKAKYDEIIGLLKKFKLQYAEQNSTPALGDSVKMIRLTAESSRQIHKIFGADDRVDFIPAKFLEMSERQSKLFLETYLKADGTENCKIATTRLEILDGLQQIAVNAGYGFTVSVRKPTIGKKLIYILRLVRHSETYIARTVKVDYNGVIWCPSTDNQTVIARRNGKVFITGNCPFTNVTMDLFVPSTLANEPAIVGGLLQKEVYGEFQKEMDMFNQAFIEVMTEGDKKGRVLSWPIPTYNVTKDWDWDAPIIDKIMDMTAKYGIPYFSNFVNSDMKPEDARSMCCRLRLDNRELRHRGGSLFGANPLTGSLGVVTINLARLGFISKDKEEFFEKLAELMDMAKESLLIKRQALEKFTEGGLYPYSRYYLNSVKERFGEYWKNHFNTIGINGANESCLNLLKANIASPEGHRFARQILDFMRERLMDYQNETNHLFNLEATPAEGTGYRFAKIDKAKFPDIIVANEEAVRNSKAAPYYTNSTHLPVNYTDDIFEALRLQDDLQTRYTGGTVLHGFVGERLPSVKSTKSLVRKIAENFRLPYFTITPTFSVCPLHGYIEGEHEYCPTCDEEMGYVSGAVIEEKQESLPL